MIIDYSWKCDRQEHTKMVTDLVCKSLVSQDFGTTLEAPGRPSASNHPRNLYRYGGSHDDMSVLSEGFYEGNYVHSCQHTVEETGQEEPQ